ncbi:bacteriophage abortive infection AbiH family protein [Microbacterium candidum]|uniref:Bacteriophage abortive infection AbiH family protein n=1 Tax=Microbacterium candidum TaxID=3041922 RepID=A0ABT7N3B9_9MICO|nr:bacteriophage abortive infection AbiH family protein [Microbacterium sp. ASV49]MDL9981199.1 bacteriophage abortive infection AbiH family protein [Microbacterium sp. ASV49]
MSSLFVLGNGFDLQHHLPTSYDPHLKALAIEGERFPGEWESYSIAGNLWAAVEEGLAYPDVDMILEHLEYYAPDVLSDRESDRDGIIHEAEQLLSFPLDKFAQNADAELENTAAQEKFAGLFGQGDYFLTFNYTHTLQRLYGIAPSRILHLHGEVGVNRLILGYAPGGLRGTEILGKWDSEENFEFYRSRAYEAVARRMADFEKIYQHEAMTEFIGQIPSSTGGIKIYGHSFGSVDRPYFDRLARSFDGVPWTVFAHNDQALEDMCRALDAYRLGVVYEGHVI